MNEAERVSLERHLRKTFPKIKHLSVQVDEHTGRFYIQGDDIIQCKFSVWRESDKYTMDNFGWETDWDESYNLGKL